jgi:glutathione S-transferase
VPKGEDQILKVRQIQVLADGACDAMGLVFFETSRGELKSTEWEARQLRKVYGVLKACDELVVEANGGFLVGKEFSVADVGLVRFSWFIPYSWTM